MENGDRENGPDEIQVIADKMTSYEFVDDYVLVGRSSRNHITIRDAGISRVHCIIIRTGSRRYRVIDLGSSNGTFVNGGKVASCIMGPEDVIKIGNTVLIFHLSKKKYSSFFNSKGELKFPTSVEAGEDADTDVDLAAESDKP